MLNRRVRIDKMRELGKSLQFGGSTIRFEVRIGDCVHGEATCGGTAATHRGGKAADSGDEDGDTRPKGSHVLDSSKLHFVGRRECSRIASLVKNGKQVSQQHPTDTLGSRRLSGDSTLRSDSTER